MKTSILLAVIFLSISLKAFACQVTSTQIDSETSFKSYSPKSAVASEQIMLLPPTGGENIADRRLAKFLCGKGFKVEIVNFPQNDGYSADLGIHDRTNLKALASIHSFLELKPEPFVVIGSSLGGIYATFVHSLGLKNDARFPLFSLTKGMITVVAGGPLSKVLAESTLGTLQAQRELRFKTYGYSGLKEYEKILDEAITLDQYKEAIASDSAYMFINHNDTVVPAKTQSMLAEKMTAKTVNLYAKSHSRAIAYVYYQRGNQIFDMVKDLLK